MAHSPTPAAKKSVKPTIAYKLRGPAQLDVALDIIYNQRLYCADWDRLNDPMEGRFVFGDSTAKWGDKKTEVAKLIREKQKLRVCSLTATYHSHLLWAHYATGFEGLAVQVNLPADDPRVKKITYLPNLREIEADEDYSPPAEAQQVLTTKYTAWRYEKEVRILHDKIYYPLATPVQRVIVGHRMRPALLDVLKKICAERKIVLKRTHIATVGITLHDL